MVNYSFGIDTLSNRQRSNRFVFFAISLASFVACLLFSEPLTAQDVKTDPVQAVLLVVGAEGASEYQTQFKTWAKTWEESASHTQLAIIGLNEQKANSKEQIRNAIEKAADNDRLQEVWLVMIGHGTFDGKRAKFNLHGPDVGADEMNAWLKPLTQRIVILNCSSCSSPFINAISGKNRIVVSATRSGFEYNFSRFGQYLAASIDDPAIDLNKDGQTSVLEAFCAASRNVGDFYQQENRIATEHALIDDNGDAKGTPADWFDGVRANRRPKTGLPDGFLANQVFLKRRGVESSLSASDRKTRNRLERQLEQIRLQKGTMDESEYLLKIEPVLVRLAQLYQRTDNE